MQPCPDSSAPLELCCFSCIFHQQSCHVSYFAQFSYALRAKISCACASSSIIAGTFCACPSTDHRCRNVARPLASSLARQDLSKAKRREERKKERELRTHSYRTRTGKFTIVLGGWAARLTRQFYCFLVACSLQRPFFQCQ